MRFFPGFSESRGWGADCEVFPGFPEVPGAGARTAVTPQIPGNPEKNLTKSDLSEASLRSFRAARCNNRFCPRRGPLHSLFAGDGALLVRFSVAPHKFVQDFSGPAQICIGFQWPRTLICSGFQWSRTNFLSRTNLYRISVAPHKFI